MIVTPTRMTAFLFLLTQHWSLQLVSQKKCIPFTMTASIGRLVVLDLGLTLRTFLLMNYQDQTL